MAIVIASLKVSGHPAEKLGQSHKKSRGLASA